MDGLDAITTVRRHWKDHSRATSGGADASGDICTGADGAAGGVARACLGAAGGGGFFAAGAGEAAAAGGAAPLDAAAGRIPVPGSAVMMLTGGVEAAVGNSALVGRPTSTEDPSGPCGATSDPCAASGAPGASCPGAAAAAEPCSGDCGMFHAAA